VSLNKPLMNVPFREEISGWWRKSNNEEHHYKCTSLNIKVVKSIRMRWARNVALFGKMRNAYKIIVGKTEG
jgi:hypothetical protein